MAWQAPAFVNGTWSHWQDNSLRRQKMNAQRPYWILYGTEHFSDQMQGEHHFRLGIIPIHVYF